MDRNTRLDDDLRRPGRRGTLRRLDRRDCERRQRVLRLPGLDPGHRRRDHRAGRLRGDDRLRGGPAGIHGRPLPGHLPEPGERGRDLHDHEHGAPLDGAGRQGMGRSGLVGNALRRRQRAGALRRLHRRDRERPGRLLHVPGLDPGRRRRDRGAVRLPGDDRLRRRPAGLRRRPVPGHLPRHRRGHSDVHDHQHASDDGARDQELPGTSQLGGDLRRRPRAASL